MHVTPEIVARINRIAALDKTLANLLHLAASQSATAEQLKSLGCWIHSIAAGPVGLSKYTHDFPSNENGTSHGAINDIVIEFKDNPHERWLLPKETCRCPSKNGPVFDQPDFSLFLPEAPKLTENVQTILTGRDNGETKRKTCIAHSGLVILEFHHASSKIQEMFKSRYPECILTVRYLLCRNSLGWNS